MDWLFNPVPWSNPDPQNNTMIPMQYVHHCRRLLLDHESAWINYQQRVMREGTTDTVKPSSSSQIIPWKNGQTYDCSKNTCQGNCLWDASQGHQKCKCRALYVPGNEHLNAPCSTTDNGPQLSYDQCKRLGYLEQEDAKATSTTASNEIKPIWPTLTCDQCRESFEALQANFNSYNYQQVAQCIDRLTSSTTHLYPTASSSSSHWGWYGFALIIILVLTSLIVYKLYKPKPKSEK